jgi:ubiquinone/menaquinone biosynthesis C-methylase UbiE
MPKNEMMSDFGFKGMTVLFKIVDFFHPHVAKRVQLFGIGSGMTVVDYGCGPGRYTVEIARLVGDMGKVFAIDIKDNALKVVTQKAVSQHLHNIETKLATGYHSGIADSNADMVVAIDIFFGIQDPQAFLAELARISKDTATLVIDGGHISPKETRGLIEKTGLWPVIEQGKDFFKCKKR